MFWPPHSRSGGGQGPETFLAPSADKQTGEHDKKWIHQGVTKVLKLRAVSMRNATVNVPQMGLSLHPKSAQTAWAVSYI